MSVPLPFYLANFTLEDVLEKVKALRERDLDKSSFKEKEYKQMVDRFRGHLKELLAKIKLSLAIPILLKRYSEFQDDEMRNDIGEIRKLCSPLLKSTFKHGESNDQTGKNWYEMMLDCDLIKATEILYNNKKFEAYILFPGFLSPAGMRLSRQVSAIEGYFPRLALRMPYYIDSPKILDDIFEIPQKLCVRLTNEAEEILKEKRELVKSEIIRKRKHIKTYEKTFLRNKELIERQIPISFHTAFRNLQSVNAKQDYHLDSLLEDRDLLNATYQATLQNNIETDRMLLQKRTKLLLQIEVWVKKYDEDIAAKMDALNQAKIQLENQRTECDEFYKKYEELGREYSELVTAQNDREMLAEAMEMKRNMAQQKLKSKKKGKGTPPKKPGQKEKPKEKEIKQDKKPGKKKK